VLFFGSAPGQSGHVGLCAWGFAFVVVVVGGGVGGFSWD